ncbi:MAG: hypothetical protein JST85_11690 [Acidobacteria bacterium]|nr:hypothetical protein [Acidobacteriota bacterium]
MSTPQKTLEGKPIVSPRYIVAGIVLLGMGLIFGYLMSRPNAGKGNLTMKIGSASVQMNVENDLQSMKALLDKVFKDDNSRREMTALLGEFHNLYQINDPKLVEKIANLKPDDSSSKALRDLCERQKGPFKNQLTEVRLSFPVNPKFGDSEAVVCSGSDYYGRRIVIYDLQEEKSVTLMANRIRPCLSGSGDSPAEKESIQITKVAAKDLFGEERLNTLNMFERGLAGIAAN